MRDDEGQEDKAPRFAADDPNYQHVHDLKDLPPHFMKEVEHFFERYKDLEGKRVQVVGWEKSLTAMEAIVDGIRRYDEAFLAVGP